ncbi:MAG: choice-of-anchor D domain-containing protein [Gammaproteobacteria bacterium]|nr:choice-of-anchor D domain-containing protein [Gammaproteobacteria bacterium]
MLSISGGSPVDSIPQGASGDFVLPEAGIGMDAGAQIFVDGTLDILSDNVTLTLYDVGSESHWVDEIRLGNTSGSVLRDKDDHLNGVKVFTNGPRPGQLVGSVTQTRGVANFEFWGYISTPKYQIVVNGQSPMMMVPNYGYASIALAYLSDTYQIVPGPTNRILVLLEDGSLTDRDYEDYVGILEASSKAVVTEPNVVGLAQAAAQSAIVNAGLVVGTVTQHSSETVPLGSVISQTPAAGTRLAVGLPVGLLVSLGPAPFDLSPTSIAFGNQALNVFSSSRTITLSNTESTDLSITSIALSGVNLGQFSLSHTCGSSVPAGSSCVIMVKFKPTTTGSKKATVTVATWDGTGTKTVSLSGTGVKSVYSVSPTTLAFGNLAVSTTSAAQTIKISNTGIVVLPISSITIGGTNPSQFSRTHNCPAQVPVGGSCSVSVKFKPTSTGLKSASLKVAAGGGASAQYVALSGNGI